MYRGGPGGLQPGTGWPVEFKDHFSALADRYERCRPGYPAELFEFLAGAAPGHRLAIDVATGNGQAATGLAPFFDQVLAT